jgi:hypothetical protein
MESGASVIHFDMPASVAESQARRLLSLQHPVTMCHGPTTASPCPILKEGGHCPMIDEAHGIIFELDLDQDEHRRILRRYLEMVDPETPVRVVTSPEAYERHADELHDVDVWTHQPTAGDLDGFAALVEAVDRAREAEEQR